MFRSGFGFIIAGKNSFFMDRQDLLHKSRDDKIAFYH